MYLLGKLRAGLQYELDESDFGNVCFVQIDFVAIIAQRMFARHLPVFISTKKCDKYCCQICNCGRNYHLSSVAVVGLTI